MRAPTPGFLIAENSHSHEFDWSAKHRRSSDATPKATPTIPGKIEKLSIILKQGFAILSVVVCGIQELQKILSVFFSLQERIKANQVERHTAALVTIFKKTIQCTFLFEL